VFALFVFSIFRTGTPANQEIEVFQHSETSFFNDRNNYAVAISVISGGLIDESTLE
jgi:hypothetical protein